jgi:hypothetical protein
MSHIYRRRFQQLLKTAAKKVLTNVVNEKLETKNIPKCRELTKMNSNELLALAGSLGVVSDSRMKMLSAVNNIRKAGHV